MEKESFETGLLGANTVFPAFKPGRQSQVAGRVGSTRQTAVPKASRMIGKPLAASSVKNEGPWEFRANASLSMIAPPGFESEFAVVRRWLQTALNTILAIQPLILFWQSSKMNLAVVIRQGLCGCICQTRQAVEVKIALVLRQGLRCRIG